MPSTGRGEEKLVPPQKLFAESCHLQCLFSFEIQMAQKEWKQHFNLKIYIKRTKGSNSKVS